MDTVRFKTKCVKATETNIRQNQPDESPVSICARIFGQRGQQVRVRTHCKLPCQTRARRAPFAIEGACIERGRVSASARVSAARSAALRLALQSGKFANVRDTVMCRARLRWKLLGERTMVYRARSGLPALESALIQ
jgi:hypothetical protein